MTHEEYCRTAPGEKSLYFIDILTEFLSYVSTDEYVAIIQHGSLNSRPLVLLNDHIVVKFRPRYRFQSLPDQEALSVRTAANQDTLLWAAFDLNSKEVLIICYQRIRRAQRDLDRQEIAGYILAVELQLQHILGRSRGLQFNRDLISSYRSILFLCRRTQPAFLNRRAGILNLNEKFDDTFPVSQHPCILDQCVCRIAYANDFTVDILEPVNSLPLRKGPHRGGGEITDQIYKGILTLFDRGTNSTIDICEVRVVCCGGNSL